jgi:hypothetical protein
LSVLIDETVLIIGFAGKTPAVSYNMNLGCDRSLVTPLLSHLLDAFNMVPMAAMSRAILGKERVKPKMHLFPFATEPTITVVAMFI